MKKLYLMVCAVLAGAALQSQVNVTFSVDMNQQTVNGAGVHLAGNFQNPATGITNPSYSDWTPANITLTDANSDGIYETTLQLQPAKYEFKFLNGDAWGTDESVPQACQWGVDGNTNRYMFVTGDTTLLVCFGSCAPCGQKTVRFRVDMSTQSAVSPNGVHVAGNFQNPNWQAGASPLIDPDGNNVWEGYYNVGTADAVEFKYINGNAWDNPNENLTDQPCGLANGNRSEVVNTDNVVLPIYCWNACESCVLPTVVTFKVDMSNETVSPNGVYVAGAFQNWSPGQAGYQCTDTNGDNIYECTVAIAPGTYQYKFVNGNAWSGAGNSNESPPADCNTNGNRSITVAGATQTVEYCYNQCAPTCVPNPNPADITFAVSMNQTTVSPQGVWLIGDFTNPQWQSGATQMTDTDGDGVFTATVNVSGQAEIKYKFVNGDVNTPANEENTGIDTCGVANGIGGYNRTHIRTGSPEVLPAPCFNSCVICFVGVNENEVVESLQVFPNPVTDQLNLSFNSAVSQDLTIRVMNNLGQIVTTQTLEKVYGSKLIQMNSSNWSTGIYTLQISNGKTFEIYKIAVR